VCIRGHQALTLTRACTCSTPPVVPDVRAVVQGVREVVHVPEAELVHAIAVGAELEAVLRFKSLVVHHIAIRVHHLAGGSVRTSSRAEIEA